MRDGPPTPDHPGAAQPPPRREAVPVEFAGARTDPWAVPHRQRVGRPEAVVLGAPPSWQVPPRIDIATLRAALGPLDPEHLALLQPISAVLVPILFFERELAVLLTRRSSSLNLDPGNISFPGGHVEAGEHPLDAALREAEEEIGLDPAAVEVLGCLELVERIRDGQRVASVVGLIAGEPTLSANADEVDAILIVPLSALFADGAAWQEHWGEGRREVRFFSHPMVLGDDLVWGLTARILWDLLERLAAVARDAEEGGAPSR